MICLSLKGSIASSFICAPRHLVVTDVTTASMVRIMATVSCLIASVKPFVTLNRQFLLRKDSDRTAVTSVCRGQSSQKEKDYSSTVSRNYNPNGDTHKLSKILSMAHL